MLSARLQLASRLSNTVSCYWEWHLYTFCSTGVDISVVIHRLLSWKRPGSHHGSDGGYASLISSSEGETHVCIFFGASVTGQPEVCSRKSQFIEQLIRQKQQSHILLASNSDPSRNGLAYQNRNTLTKELTHSITMAIMVAGILK